VDAQNSGGSGKHAIVELERVALDRDHHLQECRVIRVQDDGTGPKPDPMPLSS